MKSFKKYISSLTLCAVLTFASLTSVWAEPQNTATEPVIYETEAVSESETISEEEELLKLLPEDKVTTEDLLIYSRAGLVMDADTGVVLYAKNPDDALYPASITKLMTTYLGMTMCDPADQLTISQNAIDQITWDSSQLGLNAGQVITVEEALYALMVVSANDISNALAEHISGSIDQFVELMNYEAKVLGCSHTHFMNPHGLHDDQHVMSVYDAALIARACYSIPEFKDYCSANVYQFTSEIDRTEAQIEQIKKENNGEIPDYKLYSHHKMVNQVYPYAPAIGGKTGYTKEARNCLATYASDGSHTLICIVFNCPGGGQNYLYKDTQALFDYGFEHYAQLAAASDRKAGCMVYPVPYDMHIFNDQIVPHLGLDLSTLGEVDIEATLSHPLIKNFHLMNYLTYDKIRSVSLNQEAPGEDLTLTQSFVRLVDITENEKKSNDEIIVGILITALCVIVLLIIITWLFRLSRRKYKRLHYKSMKRRRLREESHEED